MSQPTTPGTASVDVQAVTRYLVDQISGLSMQLAMTRAHVDALSEENQALAAELQQHHNAPTPE